MEKKATYEKHLFSASIINLFKELEVYTGGTTLSVMSQKLIIIHPDYGRIPHENSEAGKSLFEELINFLLRKINFLKEKKYNISELATEALSIFNAPPKGVINGRLLLIAILLSEYTLYYKQLTDKIEWEEKVKGLLEQLLKELFEKEQIDGQKLLTSKGNQLWIGVYKTSAADEKERVDLLDTSNLSDSITKNDFLSRRALAKYISKRLRHIYPKTENNEGSFFMQLDGSWGSGKSTLLGFIKEELEQEFKHDGDHRFSDEQWIIVKFNAWENQRLNPPWWFLMKSVYTTTLKKLRTINRINYWRVLINEHFFRINAGNNYFYAAVITLILFFVASVFGINSKDNWTELSGVQVVSFIGFLWSLTKFIRSSLVPGSAKAARAFIDDNGKDPMGVLAAHFSKQVNLIGYPLAIFIDDLDRCNREYGIILLEGLQTIFKDAPVVYVVAADRRWLTTMYEMQYKDFAPAIAKPAKPFGLVFLDKTFQLILQLPDISPSQKKRYWNFLLKVVNKKENEEDNIEIVEINKKINETSTNRQKIKLAENVLGSDEAKQRVKENVIGSISIKEEERMIEHKLQNFVNLIEPNPRAMKRLINDISTTKAVNYLYNTDINEDLLILWTILKQQHPSLAAYFLDNPEKADEMKASNELKTTSEEFDKLLKKNDVKQLFGYNISDKSIGINSEFLRQLKYEIE